MKQTYTLTLFCALALSSTALNAASKTRVSESGFTMGVSQSELQWSIAGNLLGTDPDTLSELTWTDLKTLNLAYNTRNYARSGRGLYYGLNIGYGLILKGDVQDSDYLSDGRQDEFSRSNNASDGDSTLDLSLSLGYNFGRKYLIKGGWVITPMIGYSRHEQNLEMSEGYQTLATDDLTPPVGPFGGLDSAYDASWSGPWAGLRVEYDKARSFGLYFDYQVHKLDYDANAVWNLRSDFEQSPSFKHSANGEGTIASIGLRYLIKKNWYMGFSVSYQQFETKRGLDETYFTDGTAGRTQLNTAEWSSMAIMVTPSVSF